MKKIKWCARFYACVCMCVHVCVCTCMCVGRCLPMCMPRNWYWMPFSVVLHLRFLVLGICLFVSASHVPGLKLCTTLPDFHIIVWDRVSHWIQLDCSVSSLVLPVSLPLSCCCCAQILPGYYGSELRSSCLQSKRFFDAWHFKAFNMIISTIETCYSSAHFLDMNSCSHF